MNSIYWLCLQFCRDCAVDRNLNQKYPTVRSRPDAVIIHAREKLDIKL